MIPMISVRHKTTGAKTRLPETALPHFPDYVRTPTQRRSDEAAARGDTTAKPTRKGTSKATTTAAQAADSKE